MEYVLVLDLGTSRCKAAVIDQQGEIKAKHIREYDILFPEEGYAEQDAVQVWRMVKEVIKYVTSNVDYPQKINSMCFSLQGEAVIPIDREGNPLHHAILGMDTRCNNENIGELKIDLLEELGLAAPVYLVAGGHDQACAALGSGLINDFDTMNSVGTAEVLEVASKELKLNESLMNSKISTYKHLVPEMYLTMTLNHTAGLLVRWYIENFCSEEIKKAAVEKIDKYDYILRKISTDQPSYKFVVPHFSGSGTPWASEKDSGILMGLNLNDDKFILLKAILEGLVYELRVNIELLNNSGYNINKLIVVGGGARSAKWLKMRSSILGKELISTTDKDVAIMGAYILAASAVGIFNSIPEGVMKVILTRQNEIIKPEKALSAKYNQLFKLYQEIYPVNKKFNLALNHIKKYL